VTERLGARREECFFWATHAGAELDLLVVRGRKRLGFEFKRTVAPRLTPSIRSALADLRLDRLDVVHAGEQTFPLAPRVRAVALSRLLQDIVPLR
jgi:predicted AAA+ superfamily ATPase